MEKIFGKKVDGQIFTLRQYYKLKNEDFRNKMIVKGWGNLQNELRVRFLMLGIVCSLFGAWVGMIIK